ncbi:PREDICTED: snurportin-1 [Dinoponera quadriceps]|uniref:Snurportin-1 n=1 Tax=Dinoponera quadriceps TaxID=609295 RepID=A0A6P3XK73_DINQU|nr:PREDICTED: snurportin-1 [Dinoponera quadriceps]
MEEEICNNVMTLKDEKYEIIMDDENCEVIGKDEECELMEDEKYQVTMEEQEIKNKHQEKMEIRKLSYKAPVKKYDYKLEYDYESPQDERRRILLERQKKSRDDTVNAARGILEENFLFDCKKSMRRRYSRVMLSEWMLDVPEKLIDEWIMIPCPIGRRIVLVASQGKTVAYAKKGQRLSIFHSALPGGNAKTHRSKYTIIDCIWVKSQQTYYVIDVLAWASVPTMLCEAECRRFFVNSHLRDIEELRTENEINKYRILPLPQVNCDVDLGSTLEQIGEQYSLDGLLFYHRNGYYKFGFSPLAVWLKPFMLSEIFGIFVPSPYDEKPDGYIDYKHYICQITQNQRRKEYIQNHFGISMECT